MKLINRLPDFKIIGFGSASVIDNFAEPGPGPGSVILAFENFGSVPVSVLRRPNNRGIRFGFGYLKYDRLSLISV